MSSNKQEPGKFIEFTMALVTEYLEQLKRLVLNDQYSISWRDKNEDFVYKSNIE